MDHYFTNNQNLKSEIKYIDYSYKNYEFSFLSDNGVFSKNHIDYGSQLLLETYLKNKGSIPSSILDVGCGYGFLGISLSKILDRPVHMVDVNKRAVHLAKRNADRNKVDVICLESNIYEKIESKFDLIISNPPVRVGKEILLKILIDAKEYLNENGELWYVLRKDQGAKSVKEILSKYYNIEIIEKSKGFYIFCCKSC